LLGIFGSPIQSIEIGPENKATPIVNKTAAIFDNENLRLSKLSTSFYEFTLLED